MMPQAETFLAETEALYDVVAPLSDSDLDRETLFKQWTIDDIVAHLHFWNYVADVSLNDPDSFDELLTAAISIEGGHVAYMRVWLEGLNGHALVERWRAFAAEMGQRFGASDPDRRVKWAGPDMKVSTSITARYMETWAHGQAAYDVLGLEREPTDRLESIAFLGVKTFGWAHRNRGVPVPENPPHVRLHAPSGTTWEWNQRSDDNRIEGDAQDFCQVVTQVRNVADTGLVVVGDTARDWMKIVQCFAGPPEEPPTPGARYRATGV